MKPDYGLRLMRDGISREVDHFFYDFRLYSLTILGRGRYSTMVEVPFDAEVCALSLDFNADQLNKILSRATAPVMSHIQSELARDPASPRTVELDGEVSFGVRARLGQLQKVAHEDFVPLVCQEIL